MRSKHRDEEIVWRKKFGNKLKRLIHLKDMTQCQFAYELGVTEATLSGYINGTHIPNGYRIQQIASILGCNVNELFDIYD